MEYSGRRLEGVNLFEIYPGTLCFLLTETVRSANFV